MRRTRHGKLSFVAVSALGVVERNAVHVSDFFSLPSDQVVEIGRLVAI
ncbi:MAG TPA: hypothetical protein VGP94_05480 [Tepidisphaeraceae bacterium]|nr:hypothetical protein [Tepidisphaeraceae bacterium]